MELMCWVMEAAMKFGGGPVRGVNFTARIHEIRHELIFKLHGKPSEEITTSVVLALYRIIDRVKSIIDIEDPQTGMSIYLSSYAYIIDLYISTTQVVDHLLKISFSWNHFLVNWMNFHMRILNG